MRGRCSGAIPLPVSRTPTVTPPSSRAEREDRDVPGRRVAHGVVREVAEHLPERRRVGPDLAGARVRCSPRAGCPLAPAASRAAAMTSAATAARSTCTGFGVQLPDSIRDRSSRSSTMRCMRRVFPRIRSANCRRRSAGGSSSHERLGEPADDRQRRAQLVRDVRDEVAAHGFEPAEPREVEQREHRAAGLQRARRDVHGAPEQGRLAALGGFAVERRLQRVAQARVRAA